MPANDLKRMRPVEIIRLLNSTPEGECLSEIVFRKHRNRAGFRIGDNKNINLLAYSAWLYDTLSAPKPSSTDTYEQMRESARARNVALSLSGRDIGEIPAVKNTRRRRRAAKDFRYFCKTYFPNTFYMQWSPDHMRVTKIIERCILKGGLFALAMPRGFGKTRFVECAAMWAMLFGYRDFIAIISSDEAAAVAILESIKTELESNPLLLDDFPESIYPINRLDGIPHRAGGQLHLGKRTHIGWTSDEIVFPTIENSKSSGAIVRVAGLTGRIRGMSFKRIDGRTVRPDLVILDDPQTDESARSPSQCATRERIIAGAVLGLAGPGKKISGFMPCTIIRENDLASRILNHDKHPEWQGERTKMVYKFPTNTKLWDEYKDILIDSFNNNKGDIKPATSFYRKNRKAMDAGAEIAWPALYNWDEISAIQNAMNLLIRDKQAFYSEFQNEPITDKPDSEENLCTVDDIMRKLNNYQRGIVPVDATHLTMFVDIQDKALYYMVIAWANNFTGYIVDYDTFPEQNSQWFLRNDIQYTLQMKFPKHGFEARVYNGLESLINSMLRLEWKRDDGIRLRIERCLIDANWGKTTDTVYQFCRQSGYATLLMPSHGRFYGASTTSINEYRKKPGQQVGLNWFIPPGTGKRSVRHVVFDTNFWKSFIHTRLSIPMGDAGCLSLFGNDPLRHRLVAEHICAEYPVKVTGRGRSIDEWKLRPERFDNDWLDCAVGAAVAASMQGVSLKEIGEGVMAKTSRRIVRIPERMLRKR